MCSCTVGYFFSLSSSWCQLSPFSVEVTFLLGTAKVTSRIHSVPVFFWKGKFFYREIERFLLSHYVLRVFRCHSKVFHTIPVKVSASQGFFSDI